MNFREYRFGNIPSDKDVHFVLSASLIFAIGALVCFILVQNLTDTSSLVYQNDHVIKPIAARLNLAKAETATASRSAAQTQSKNEHSSANITSIENNADLEKLSHELDDTSLTIFDDQMKKFDQI